MSDKVEVNSGMGLASWLTVIFVIAKLAKVINWSWWLVFAPVIVSTAIGLTILAVTMVVAGVVYLKTR